MAYGEINRVPISYYEDLQIPVPKINEQQKIVSQIEELEKQIADAKSTMAECPSKKQQVLDKYLN